MHDMQQPHIDLTTITYSTACSIVDGVPPIAWVDVHCACGNDTKTVVCIMTPWMEVERVTATHIVCLLRGDGTSRTHTEFMQWLRMFDTKILSDAYAVPPSANECDVEFGRSISGGNHTRFRVGIARWRQKASAHAPKRGDTVQLRLERSGVWLRWWSEVRRFGVMWEAVEVTQFPQLELAHDVAIV